MFYIAGLALFFIIALVLKFKGSGPNSIDRPLNVNKLTVEQSNDKMIVVDNVKHSEIISVLSGFCKAYNENDYAVQLRLYQISDKKFSITFPFDVSFTIFCFAINYLKYPIEVKWDAEVYGWATIKETDGFTIDNVDNKLSMFYLEKDDKEYDNVFLTTSNGIGYKIPFTNLKPKILTLPPESFKKPSVKIEELNGLPHQEFD
ncbi:hypothetical protein ACFQZI_11810 [Mucilaginibacter lutimaris]|uniref:Uncharacterized protein n=1 Tax=Mucilaginibacter lutimaris TaxID=931629 RepID=A0ABW2ZH46_9SPHI